jgi:hypothetical protein
VLRRFAADHLGLLLSTIVATTIIAKIWSVAHGGMPTVTAIVASGALTSLLGALLSGLPLLGGVPLVFAASMLAEAIREGDNWRGPAVATAVALVVAAVLAPVAWLSFGLALLVGTCALSLLMIGLRRAWTARFRRKLPFPLKKSEFPQDMHPAVLLALLAVFAWVAVASSDRPWMPLENVSTKNGTLTGFVIDDGGSSTLILKDSDRSVLRIPTDEVTSRVICTKDDTDERSLVGQLAWQNFPQYPLCNSD